MGQFKAAEIGAAGLKRELKSIHGYMMAGGLQIAAGVGILAMFKPAIDEAKRFQQLTTTFATSFGMGDAANAQAIKFAKSMNIMGTSYVDAMKLINESQGVFRESGKLTLSQQFEGARIASPILAKLAFIDRGLSDEERSSRHAQDLAMLRFIESRGGANDPRVFAGIADWGFKLSRSSGGIVDWSQLQQFAATSGAAGYNLTQDAISKLEPVIADLKGGRLGSGLRVSFQRLLGTQRGLPKQAISEFLSLGLWDPSKVELTKSGSIKQFLGQPGAMLRDRTKFATDPVAFYTEDFLPAITKKYGAQILGDSAQAKVERAAEISMVFGPGTAGAVFSQIDKLLPAIQRSLGAQGKSLGIDATYAATGKTLAGKEVDMAAKFKSLLEQTGEVALPLAVQALETILPVLTGVSNFAQAHPRMFGFIIDGVMALGAALIVSGTATSLVGLYKAAMLFSKVVGPLSTATRLLASTSMAGDVANIGIAATKIPMVAAGLALVEAPIAALAALPLVAIGVGLSAIAAAALAMFLVHKYQGHVDESKNNHGGHGVHPGQTRGPAVVVNPYSPKNVRQHTSPAVVVNPFSPQVTRTARGFVQPPMRGQAARPIPLVTPAARQAVDHFTGALGTSQVALAGQRQLLKDTTASTAALSAAEHALASWLTGAIGSMKSALANMAQSTAKPNVPPPAKGAVINLHHTTLLDGRVVGKSTSKYLAASLNGPNSVSHGFDPGAALGGSAAGYARA